MVKAEVLYQIDSELEIVDLSISSPKDKEVLISMDSAGLCASDLHVMKGEIPYPTPIVLGHEGAGTIKEIGPNVSSVKVGDRCIVSFISSCGLCKQCRSGFANHCEKHYENTHNQLDGTLRLTDQNDKEIYQMHKFGAFSELQVVPESSLFKIPDELSSSAAALIGCCVTTGLGGIINQENVPIGSTVAVFGCGGVGLNVIQGAKILNSTKIIAVDVFEHKLEFAYKFGATDVVNAKEEDAVEKIKEITGGGVDFAFDSFGGPLVMEQAINSLGRRGTAVLVGIAPVGKTVNVNMVELVRDQKKIVGSYYGHKSPHETFRKITDLYLSGKIDVDNLIREEYKIEEINKGFRDLERGEDGRGVIVF